MEGFVVLKVPDFDQAMDFQDLKYGEQTVDAEGKIEAHKQSINQILRKAVKMLDKLMVEIDLTMIKSGKKITSYADMLDDMGCHSILIDIAGQYISGMPLGND